MKKISLLLHIAVCLTFTPSFSMQKENSLESRISEIKKTLSPKKKNMMGVINYLNTQLQTVKDPKNWNAIADILKKCILGQTKIGINEKPATPDEIKKIAFITRRLEMASFFLNQNKTYKDLFDFDDLKKDWGFEDKKIAELHPHQMIILCHAFTARGYLSFCARNGNAPVLSSLQTEISDYVPGGKSYKGPWQNQENFLNIHRIFRSCLGLETEQQYTIPITKISEYINNFPPMISKLDSDLVNYFNDTYANQKGVHGAAWRALNINVKNTKPYFFNNRSQSQTNNRIIIKPTETIQEKTQHQQRSQQNQQRFSVCNQQNVKKLEFESLSVRVQFNPDDENVKNLPYFSKAPQTVSDVNGIDRTAYTGMFFGKPLTLLSYKTIGGGQCGYAAVFQALPDSWSKMAEPYCDIIKQGNHPYQKFLNSLSAQLNMNYEEIAFNPVEVIPFIDNVGFDEITKALQQLKEETFKIYVWLKEKNGIMLNTLPGDNAPKEGTKIIHILLSNNEQKADGHYTLLVPSTDKVMQNGARHHEKYVENMIKLFNLKN